MVIIEGLISIIVPVYNVVNYLDRCVESLVCQSYRKIEILLIDDGSTDGSYYICDYWGSLDNRVKVFHISNHGVSYARNIGLDNAHGEYIGFVDGDDWIEAYMYEHLLRAINSTNAHIAVGGYVMEYVNDCNVCLNVGEAKLLSSEEAIKEAYTINDNHLFGWSLCDKLFKRRLWIDVRLDCSFSMAEDMLTFWMILEKIEYMAYLPLFAYHYCFRSESACNTMSLQHIFDDLNAKERMLNYAIHNYSNWIYIGIVEKLYIDSLVNFVHNLLKHETLLESNQKKIEHHLDYLYSKNIISLLRDSYSPTVKIKILLYKLPIKFVTFIYYFLNIKIG